MKAVQRRWDKLQSRNRVSRWANRTWADVTSRLSPSDFWYGRYPTPPGAKTAGIGRRSLGGARGHLVLLDGHQSADAEPCCVLGADARDQPADARGADHPRPSPELRGIGAPLARRVRQSLVRPPFGLSSGVLPAPLRRWISDLKRLRGPWHSPLDRLRTSDEWLLGSQLTDPAWAGQAPGRLGTHLRRYYRQIASESTLIAKSHSPLTTEWLREVERRLDYYAPP